MAVAFSAEASVQNPPPPGMSSRVNYEKNVFVFFVAANVIVKWPPCTLCPSTVKQGDSRRVQNG